MCLGNSFNIPAVKTEYATGIDYITNVELAMGVKSHQPNCSLTTVRTYNELADTRSVGGDTRIAHLRHHLLDLADGAATLGDLGVQHNPMPVTSIAAQADRADGLDVQRRGRRTSGDPRERRVHHG